MKSGVRSDRSAILVSSIRAAFVRRRDATTEGFLLVEVESKLAFQVGIEVPLQDVGDEQDSIASARRHIPSPASLVAATGIDVCSAIHTEVVTRRQVEADVFSEQFFSEDTFRLTFSTSETTCSRSANAR